MGELEIQVIGVEGEERSLRVAGEENMKSVLTRGVYALYGPQADVSKYQLVIDGQVISDLQQSKVVDYHLSSGAEVLVEPIDMRRG